MGGMGFAAVAAILLAGHSTAEEPECRVTYSAAPAITDIFRDRGFAFETYEDLCAALHQHGLEMTITGSNGILLERAYGWASVTARRTATGALSTREHVSTSMDAEATEEVAADLLYMSVNDAANALLGELAEHLRSIEAEENRMRAAFGGGGSHY